MARFYLSTLLLTFTNIFTSGGEVGRDESGSLQRQAPSPSSIDEERRQESNTKPHCYTVFIKCLIPQLLLVVGIKFQAISQDPLITLPLNTWSFVISIFIYCLILLAMKHPRIHRNINLQIILGQVSLASGVVSTLSLVSLLVPLFPGLIVLYISWVLFVMISALPGLQCAYKWLLRAITNVLNILVPFASSLFNEVNPSLQQPSPQGTRPPV